MIPPFLDQLVEYWKKQANALEAYGATQSGATLRLCARELAQARDRWLDEELSVAEAERETRWSERFLRDQVRAGRLKSVRGASPVRIRRGDLLAFDPNTDATPKKKPALELAR